MKNFAQLHIDNIARPRLPLNVGGSASEASIYIYDIISADWGVSASAVVAALNQVASAEVLHVYLNSPGGDVFEGRAIMAALERFQGKTVAHIDSLCASAATSIAITCDEVEISDGAFFMIHNASGMAWGDKDELRSVADTLEKIEGSIVNDYVKKTGADVSQVVAWMNEETWFTAAEAIKFGFVDRLAVTAKASNTWNLSAFAKAPSALSPVAAAAPAPEQVESKPEHKDMKAANENRLRLSSVA